MLASRTGIIASCSSRSRANHHFPAYRRSTQFCSVSIDERHQRLPRRQTFSAHSALAKNAKALRKISFARCSSFTLISSTMTRFWSLAACDPVPAPSFGFSRHQRRSRVTPVGCDRTFGRQRPTRGRLGVHPPSARRGCKDEVKAYFLRNLSWVVFRNGVRPKTRNDQSKR